jgi:hypothetical protein
LLIYNSCSKPQGTIKVENLLQISIVFGDKKNIPLPLCQHFKSFMGNFELKETFDEHGERISPVLAEGKKNYLIDIDGTICDDIPNEEPERMVTVAAYPDALRIINKWFDEGHNIVFFTSRTDAHKDITNEWLVRNGFKYHGLLLNKPRGGNYHWIDNHIVRATRYKGKFTDLISELREVEVFED